MSQSTCPFSAITTLLDVRGERTVVLADPERGRAESVEVRRGPEEVAAQRQMAALFARILDSIDEPLREVFVLQAIERVGTRETAATLRIPPGTVASRTRRARSQLRARIAILRRGR